MEGESDSQDNKQVWCKPAYLQRMCKDLILSATDGPVKAVLLLLVTDHSPYANCKARGPGSTVLVDLLCKLTLWKEAL